MNHQPFSMQSQWNAVSDVIRLRNQSGTLLLMLPTWWALVLSTRGHPPVHLLLVFAAGAFLMRSVGVVINDLTDRRYDRQVERTRDRPLASGRLSPGDALITGGVLLAGAAALLLFVNPTVRALSPIAILLASVYPFSKRVLPIPQAVLGIAFGWGVIMAWAAVRGAIDTEAWLLYGATVCWAVAYDTIYAWQDREDDARIGLHSSAVLFGEHAWLAVAIALAAMLALISEAGRLGGAGTFFYAGVLAVGVLFARQVRLLREGVDGPGAFRLFREHIWAGWIILIGLWLGLL
jgi:4-hydroxybenzoate polyprenyltransferase